MNDVSSGHYSINKNIRFETSMLRSDLCDYSNAYIVVKGIINVKATQILIQTKKMLCLKIMHHLDHA